MNAVQHALCICGWRAIVSGKDRFQKVRELLDVILLQGRLCSRCHAFVLATLKVLLSKLALLPFDFRKQLCIALQVRVREHVPAFKFAQETLCRLTPFREAPNLDLYLAAMRSHALGPLSECHIHPTHTSPT